MFLLNRFQDLAKLALGRKKIIHHAYCRAVIYLSFTDLCSLIAKNALNLPPSYIVSAKSAFWATWEPYKLVTNIYFCPAICVALHSIVKDPVLDGIIQKYFFRITHHTKCIFLTWDKLSMIISEINAIGGLTFSTDWLNRFSRGGFVH